MKEQLRKAYLLVRDAEELLVTILQEDLTEVFPKKEQRYLVRSATDLRRLERRLKDVLMSLLIPEEE